MAPCPSRSRIGCRRSCRRTWCTWWTKGRIVEYGTHERLLRDCGLYASLYQEQFDGGRVESRCEDGIILSDGTVLSREEMLVGAGSA